MQEVNPRIVFLTISGYGLTGPYRDYPSHGIAYDSWAGVVLTGLDDQGFSYIPEHVSVGINAGPLYGAFGILAGITQARATGHGCRLEVAQSDSAAAIDWLRSESYRAYERPESEATGTASDGYRRRAPGTAGMAEGVRYNIYESADGHVLSWRPNASSGRTSAMASGVRNSSSNTRVSSTPTTPSATSGCAVS